MEFLGFLKGSPEKRFNKLLDELSHRSSDVVILKAEVEHLERDRLAPGARLKGMRQMLSEAQGRERRTRERAAATLGELSEARAVGPLVASLSDDYPEVRMSAFRALVKITGRDLGEGPEGWAQWLDGEKETGRGFADVQGPPPQSFCEAARAEDFNL